jgi:S1-C subfamily serine protease
VAARSLGLAATLAAAALGVALLALRGGDSNSIEPLRVTSGHEIATGFAVGGDRVLTVAHALHGAPAVAGRRARVLRVDRRSDLALLAVPGLEARAVELDSAAADDRLRLLGLRGGRVFSQSVRVRRAIVAHVRAPGAARAAARPALELAARVVAGDSGAPVVSRSGELAGVAFAASRRRPGTAYAVDAAAVARLLARD